jgi:hypothetical protein
MLLSISKEKLAASDINWTLSEYIMLQKTESEPLMSLFVVI